ncbi:MAG: sugar ABC transporter substrate-binding protein [Candidatus Adiutrix sp.]|jgi:ABC-type sugar transport system substrate-binding protein|nr:sugar ABC transporter substrate-binding protein [Candidatus Adiutrix sp.]
MFKALTLIPYLALALALASPAPAAELSRAAGSRKAYLGLAIHSTANEYWNQQAEGGRLFAATLPPGAIETRILTCDSDAEKQLDGLKDFIALHGRDAILYVDPAGAANTAAIAELCEEAGVFWTSVWHLAVGLKPQDFHYFVMHQSVDGVKQGYDIAVELFNSFPTPGRGRILALQGPLDNDSSVERYEGLQKALAEYDVELLDTQVSNWDSRAARAATEIWLAQFPDIDGIWSANDDMALGAIQALKAAGRGGRIKVVGVDGVSAALAAIENGDMVCTVANNGYLQGGYGAAYAYKAWAGEINPAALPDRQRAFYTEGRLVNKNNLDQYRRDFIAGVPYYDYNNLEFPISRPRSLR